MCKIAGDATAGPYTSGTLISSCHDCAVHTYASCAALLTFGYSRVRLRLFGPRRSKTKCSPVPNAWGRLEDVPNESERFAVSSRRSDELSNAGFSFGYFAGVLLRV